MYNIVYFYLGLGMTSPTSLIDTYKLVKNMKNNVWLGLYLNNELMVWVKLKLRGTATNMSNDFIHNVTLPVAITT